jgi:uncharacterized membrane protein
MLDTIWTFRFELLLTIFWGLSLWFIVGYCISTDNSTSKKYLILVVIFCALGVITTQYMEEDWESNGSHSKLEFNDTIHELDFDEDHKIISHD